LEKLNAIVKSEKQTFQQETAKMIDLLRARRSVRKYEDRPIEPETIEILKEAALRSPSSRNIQPWEFIFVDDRGLLAELARSKPRGASFLAGAALGVVVCADAGKSDTWIEDCSIASILLQLTARSLGLGSCWIQIRGREHADGKPAEAHIRKLLSLPENLAVESIMSIGYAAVEKAGVPKGALDMKKIRRNRWA
jgi:nitroreductase